MKLFRIQGTKRSRYAAAETWEAALAQWRLDKAQKEQFEEPSSIELVCDDSVFLFPVDWKQTAERLGNDYIELRAEICRIADQIDRFIAEGGLVNPDKLRVLSNRLRIACRKRGG